MAKVLPFHGLLPLPDKAAQVAAVPYDVVDSAEAAELAKDNPLSFLRVSRPEIEMEPGIDLHDDSVYAKAKANFERLCKQAPLELDKEPHLYVYSLKMGDHEQTGIAAAVAVSEYENGIIKKHEKTRKDKEDDRTRHVVTLRSHTGPVFLTYRDSAAIDKLVAAVKAEPPLFDFTAPDGIVHKFWKADTATSEQLSKAFDTIPYLYIADGHHRSAAAARSGIECRSKNPNHRGDEDYNEFLAVVFPASQLQILPYNRAVHDLNGLTPESLLEKIGEKFSICEASSPSPAKSGEFCMYLEDKWYLLEPKFDIASLGVIEQLDVSILQDNILGPLLGIDDPRTSKRIDFVGGIRGTGELEQRVNSGRAKVAFSMYPTTVEQLMAIADADAIMPPKSTWFEPKLRDGMVCHNF